MCDRALLLGVALQRQDYVGLLRGILLGQILSAAVQPLIFDWETGSGTSEAVRSHRKALLSLLLTVFCCYVSVSTHGSF